MRKYTFGMLAATGALAVSAGLTGAATASNAFSAASPEDGRVGILDGCSWAWPCGEVQNDSGRSVRVSLNWTCDAKTAPLGSSCPKEIKTVKPGAHKGGGDVDVDAFEVPKGCKYYFKVGALDPEESRTAGWYKFNNSLTITITRTSC
ncbi:hypothetical protein [Streptomyces sp. NPDC053720]|uniref:hypothetical protein n=1 Tax=Streptomyces sp. NPDC053720 TaxID=3154855 RepID=UPI00341DF2A8